jgi:hypothetical protein
VAIPGADGRRAAELLRGAQSQGARVLAAVTRRAVARLLRQGGRVPASGQLYDAAERAEIQDALAATLGTAELLGRARVRLRQQAARERANNFRGAPKVSRQSDGRQAVAADEPGWAAFDEGAEVPPLAPEAAVNFFKGLVPTLGVDPQRFGADQRRKAFRLAATTDQTVLERVKAVLQKSLEEGTGSFRDVDKVLADAGVHPANPQTSDMIFRTNMADAYQEGQWEELQDPDVADVFIAWRYDAVLDGRQRDSHAAHNGKYFPSSVPFRQVRDSIDGEYSGYNCRCSATPIDRWAWEALQAEGARLEEGW